jgi:transposase
MSGVLALWSVRGPVTGRIGGHQQRQRGGWVKVRLGIDVACRADHQASLTGADGEFLWSGWRFRTTPVDLEALWDRIPAGAAVQVILEPTRNAWVPLAAWLAARGAEVVLVPPEQSADLRDYYNKHTKTDRLDSRTLARLPLLHPEGLQPYDGPTPADPFRRAVRRRAKLVKARTTCFQRLDALLELLGPAYALAMGAGDYTKTALTVLERYADPRALKRQGPRRLTALMIKTSGGAWREAKAQLLLAAADEALALWSAGGLDFAELALDIAAEVRVTRALNDEIAMLEARIAPLFTAADRRPAPANPDGEPVDDGDERGIVASVPTLGGVLGAGILARFGDFDRFHSLGGVRAFTGLVPKVDQSGNSHGHHGLTKAGDPGLREALYLAADLLRRVDPQLAARYYRLMVDEGKHHDSALCSVAAVVATRIAGCWRNRERYVLRDTDGTPITESEGRAIVADRFKIPDTVRQARRRAARAKQLKRRTGRRRKESTAAAPASGPSAGDANEKVA